MTATRERGYRENAWPQMPTRPRRSWWSRTKTRVLRKLLVAIHTRYSKNREIGFKYVDQIMTESIFKMPNGQENFSKIIDCILHLNPGETDETDHLHSLQQQRN